MIYRQSTNTDEFIVFDIQENKLRPEMCLLRRFDNLGNIDAGDEKFKMFHDCKGYQIKITQKACMTYAWLACIC